MISRSHTPLHIAITRNDDDALVRAIDEELRGLTQDSFTISGAAVTEIRPFPLHKVRPFLDALGGRSNYQCGHRAESISRGDEVPPQYDWIVMTSKNTVVTLHEYAQRIGSTLSELFQSTPLCSVGAATTAALHTHHCHPTWSANGSAASIVDLWPDHVQGTGLHIAVPGSALSRPTLSQGLKAYGHHVDLMPIYTTEPIQPLPDIFDDHVNIVVALAGSSIDALQDYLATHPDIALVTIGKPSAHAARQRGFEVSAVAQTPDAHGLSEAIVEAIQRQKRK